MLKEKETESNHMHYFFSIFSENANDFSIVAGQYDKSTNSGQEQIKQIAQVTMHPQYNRKIN